MVFERIDVHAHAITPKYREYLLQTGHHNPDGWPIIPEWTPEQHLAMMKENNISTSILSLSTPGVCLRPLDAALTKEIARTTNIELSEVCAAYPQQFRFFASLPLPHVADTLEEIDYALDKLGAAGFCILSNAAGVYPGDPSLDRVFSKLNERRAIVFTHPTTCKVLLPTCSHDHPIESEKQQLAVVQPVAALPSGLLEYMFDETRAISNLITSGTVTRNPSIKFIMSHAGCVLPPLLERVAVALQNFFGGGLSSEEMRQLLRERFWFDLAGLPWPDMVHGLLRVVGPERLMYGSDYCWTPPALVKKLVEQMNQGAKELWTDEIIGEVYAGNARRLFDL